MTSYHHIHYTKFDQDRYIALTLSAPQSTDSLSLGLTSRSQILTHTNPARANLSFLSQRPPPTHTPTHTRTPAHTHTHTHTHTHAHTHTYTHTHTHLHSVSYTEPM